MGVFLRISLFFGLMFIAENASTRRRIIFPGSLAVPAVPAVSECGNPHEREVNLFPWIVNLGYKYPGESVVGYRCMGVLISQRFVVTAAACVIRSFHQSGSQLVVVRFPRVLGEHVIASVENTTYFPDYIASVINDDIGLVQLKTTAQYKDGVPITPICLPSTDFDLTGEVSQGAGLLEAGRPFNPLDATELDAAQLLTVEKLLDDKECEDVFSTKYRKEQMICVLDSCLLSGSALMLDSAPFTLVGLASFGKSPCVKRSTAAVYTSVIPYRHWITRNIRDI